MKKMCSRSVKPRINACSSSSPRTAVFWSSSTSLHTSPLLTGRRNCASSEWKKHSSLSTIEVNRLYCILVFFSSHRYANVACELLTCDVSLINDKVGGDESLLNTLYNFLEQTPPINPLLASFFSKTVGTLISRKTEQVREICLFESLLGSNSSSFVFIRLLVS